MPILECKQLSKSYGKAPALENVSFAIEPGRIVGLLGPNGSGKTTLIKLANGLLTPDSGEILIDGAAPGRETHAGVSYLPERTAIPIWLSAGQLMDFYTGTSAARLRRRCCAIWISGPRSVFVK